jgi:hypothetical protein
MGFGPLLLGQSAAEETQSSGDASPSTASTPDLLPCTGSQQPANFTVYSLGPVANGLTVSSEYRRCDTYLQGAPGRANFVSYIYGQCTIATGDDRCTPPLEIQTWPACERALADYQLEPGTPYPNTYLGELRGVPAYSFDNGNRIELYTGGSTIAIFSTDPALAKLAIPAIKPESGSTPPPETPEASLPGGNLPPPAPGSTTGTLSCD